MIFRIARIVAIAAALFFTLHASAQQQTFTVCPALGGSDWAVNLAYDGPTFGLAATRVTRLSRSMPATGR